MAIQWGAWEGSSPTRIRVGIDVSWEAVTHGEAAATATVKYYTDVEGNWSDSQTLNLSGAIDGSVSFTNSQSNNQVLRETRTYTYNYGSNEYGSSPGDRTFSCNLTGAFNGATPSKSVTSAIPKRPYDTPLAPTNVSVSRVSSTSAKITWTNRDTAGEPWDTVRIQVDGAANDLWNGDIGTTGGGGTTITDSGLSLNSLYKWRVRSENSVGNSSWVETSVLYTDPSAPTIGANNPGTGSQRVINWTNNANADMSYVTEIYVSRDGGATWQYLAEVAKGVTSYTDTAASAAQKTGYRVRHQTTGGTQGTLYSAYSADSAFTVGVTSAPNPPTSLAPASNLIVIPTQPKTFSWQHNSTDTTPQSAYQIQYRPVGGSWTVLGKTSSATASWVAPAGQFVDNTSYEWQVRTWGSATTGGSDGTGASAWSATSTFKTIGDPNAARAMKRVMRLDLETGDVETAPVMSLPPIGSLLMFGGASAPEGWLLCQGQSLLRNDYPELFAVIGTTYGAVDSTHFSLPDMRDRVPMGAGGAKALGSTGGSDTVTIGTGNLPPHTHDKGTLDTTTTGSAHKHDMDQSVSDGSAPNVRRGNSTVSYTGDGMFAGSTGTHTHTITGSTGSGPGSSTPLDVKPRYQAMNYIIKV